MQTKILIENNCLSDTKIAVENNSNNAKKELEYNEDIEKYRELYYLSKEKYNQQILSRERSQNKAIIIISTFTLAQTIILFFGKLFLKEMIPPSNILDDFIIVVVFLLTLILLLSWIKILFLLRPGKIMALPLDEKEIEFYEGNSLIDIYKESAIRNMHIYDQNVQKGEEKAKLIQRIFDFGILYIILFFLLLSLFVIRKWDFNKSTKNPKGVKNHVKSKASKH
ncbi:MAG: hypothetical protein M1576_03375 [Deltaproteobacteria bacterium]|jgi:hypothetical protein|nr:hypothetical protein [Deltaproteobacteria bacterium]